MDRTQSCEDCNPGSTPGWGIMKYHYKYPSMVIGFFVYPLSVDRGHNAIFGNQY